MANLITHMLMQIQHSGSVACSSPSLLSYQSADNKCSVILPVPSIIPSSGEFNVNSNLQAPKQSPQVSSIIKTILHANFDQLMTNDSYSGSPFKDGDLLFYQAHCPLQAPCSTTLRKLIYIETTILLKA